VPDLSSVTALQSISRQAAAAEASTKEQFRQETAGPVSIVGLWQISFISGGQVVDAGFDAWHSDGTELLNDIPPPATGNVCIGVWTQTGKMTYKLKHPSWTFDLSGNLTGTAVIRETVTISSAGDKFNGTYTIDFYDNSGSSTGHFEGKVQASRIIPD
jgi:hypothetical protein